jgi:hypothetical protein
MQIIVQRRRSTKDGLFGTLTLDFNPFTCFTVENLNRSIMAGTYDVNFTYSPHFNQIMPHIIVPNRDMESAGDAGIRIHWANFPGQLEGCIAVGDKEEPDSVDNSRVTFNQLFKIISPLSSGLKIQVKDIQEDI